MDSYNDRARTIKTIIVAVIILLMAVISCVAIYITSNTTTNTLNPTDNILSTTNRSTEKLKPQTEPNLEDPDTITVDNVPYYKAELKYSLDDGKYSFEELTKTYLNYADISYSKNSNRIRIEVSTKQDLDATILAELKEFTSHFSLIGSGGVEYESLTEDRSIRQDGDRTIIFSSEYNIDSDLSDSAYIEIGNEEFGVYSSYSLSDLDIKLGDGENVGTE